MNENINKTERNVILALLVWGLGVFGLAYAGFFAAIPRPLLAGLALTGIIIPTIVYFLNKNLRDYIAGIGIKALTIFHIWRIGAGLLFVFYGSLGLLPEVFVQNAGYGDIAVGLLALILLLFPETNTKYWLFHSFGMADFILAVTTGLTLVLTGNPLMAGLTGLPIVLIPLFGVGVSGAMHIFAFDVLRKERKERIAVPAV